MLTESLAWLVDIMHPWLSRLAARRYANVRLIAADLTECLDSLPSEPPVPTRFLDEPAIDWIASVNLPQRWLQEHRPDLDANAGVRYGETLMIRHQ